MVAGEGPPGLHEYPLAQARAASTVPAVSADLPSKSQINKCGKALRDTYSGVLTPSGDELEHAIDVVSKFRAAHAYPMQKVRYGLRSMVRSEGAQEVIAQRLKRVPRIARKLHRMSGGPTGSTSLARLDDIGGCRAVLLDGPELERVRARVIHNWSGSFVRDPRDYISSPKAMGYRAVHFAVRRDDRTIEVQLRTRGQQQWADAVEAADARLGLNLKDEVGPHDMVEYFTVAGEVIYHREYGLTLGADLEARFEASRAAVVSAGFYGK